MIYLSKKVSLRLSCLLHYDFSSDEIFERSLVFGYWFHDISFVDSCRIIDTQTWVKLNRLNSIVGFKFIKKLFPFHLVQKAELSLSNYWVFETLSTLRWSWLNNLKSLRYLSLNLKVGDAKQTKPYLLTESWYELRLVMISFLILKKLFRTEQQTRKREIQYQVSTHFNQKSDRCYQDTG